MMKYEVSRVTEDLNEENIIYFCCNFYIYVLLLEILNDTSFMLLCPIIFYMITVWVPRINKIGTELKKKGTPSFVLINGCLGGVDWEQTNLWHYMHPQPKASRPSFNQWPLVSFYVEYEMQRFLYASTTIYVQNKWCF